ncbi:hypothetical protein [Burkholderia glumae]|uniref:hypothetical protein n=1 Tax=Burkholderia glumae TaxID=337 RepID=UPI00214A7ED1|nr:hypothetical protein [Burkholderia glumae]MCR1770515.1 hypothetical protein [Burkholderia glumae]
MAIISTYDTDKSGVLAKRYAQLAAQYFDKPEDARSAAARVPLENLFRILEMYRHNAFSDDHRQGVLTMISQTENYSMHPSENPWHSDIEQALGRAMHTTFGDTGKEDAVRALQGSLRWLASNGAQGPGDVRTARQFFQEFSQAL